MAGLIRVYADPQAQKLFRSHLSNDTVRIAKLFQGGAPILFTLMRPNPIGPDQVSPWERINPSEYQLGIGVYKSDGTQLAYQNAWENDQASFAKIGVLALDTAAINALLTGQTTSLPATIEICITDSDGTTTPIWQESITIQKSFMVNSTSPIAGETTATQAWVGQTFVRKIEKDGQVVVLRFGSWGVEIGVNDMQQVTLNPVQFPT